MGQSRRRSCNGGTRHAGDWYGVSPRSSSDSPPHTHTQLGQHAATRHAVPAASRPSLTHLTPQHDRLGWHVGVRPQSLEHGQHRLFQLELSVRRPRWPTIGLISPTTGHAPASRTLAVRPPRRDPCSAPPRRSNTLMRSAFRRRRWQGLAKVATAPMRGPMSTLTGQRHRWRRCCWDDRDRPRQRRRCRRCTRRHGARRRGGPDPPSFPKHRQTTTPTARPTTQARPRRTSARPRPTAP